MARAAVVEAQNDEQPTMTTPERIFSRHPKGKRPHFFDNPAMDQMMTFVVELATEVSVLRERLNTVELLLDEKGTISRDDIETSKPSDTIESERTSERTALVERIFRMHAQ